MHAYAKGNVQDVYISLSNFTINTVINHKLLDFVYLAYHKSLKENCLHSYVSERRASCL